MLTGYEGIWSFVGFVWNHMQRKLLEVYDVNLNNIENNNTNINYINPILSIYTEDAMDGMDEYQVYLLAAMFNAGATMSNYYREEVNHDMPQFAG